MFHIYPLVNVYMAMENHHLYIIGKSTINGPFSIAMLNSKEGTNLKTAEMIPAMGMIPNLTIIPAINMSQ